MSVYVNFVLPVSSIHVYAWLAGRWCYGDSKFMCASLYTDTEINTETVQFTPFCLQARSVWHRCFGHCGRSVLWVWSYHTHFAIKLMHRYWDFCLHRLKLSWRPEATEICVLTDLCVNTDLFPYRYWSCRSDPRLCANWPLCEHWDLCFRTGADQLSWRPEAVC